MITLERAIAIACEAHAGQRDKGGQPYILHPLRVMMAMQTDEERIVAILHDVLEDCPEWGGLRLIDEGVTDDCYTALCVLTKMTGEHYDSYISTIAWNPLARTVKLADLTDNMDTSRLPQPLTEADERRLAKYGRAYLALKEAGGG